MAALNMPSGFRFHPTDEELVRDYLVRKCAGLAPGAPIIAEVDLYQYDPWSLPEMALYGEKEWFFFSPRDRKYPNGVRPSRSAGIGYWKATGPDKPIGQPTPLGIKKSLVFFTGKSPHGFKTNWIMQEYRLANVDRSATRQKNKQRLDEWVLCRIYNKKGYIEKYTMPEQNVVQVQQVYDNNQPQVPLGFGTQQHPPKQHPVNNRLPQQMHNCVPPAANNNAAQTMQTMVPVPKVHAEQSSSEPVNYPDLFNKEAESEKWDDDFVWQVEGFNYSLEGLLDEDDFFGTPMTHLQMNMDSSPMQQAPLNPWQQGQFFPLHEMFMYPHQNPHAL